MRFTIGRKIWFGFGLLILLNLIVLLLTNKNLNKSKEINERLTTVYAPSIERLEEYKLRIEQSRILITYWANVESIEHDIEKKELIDIINKQIPQLKNEIDQLSENWTPNQISNFRLSYDHVIELKEFYSEVQSYLPDLASYQNATNLFLAKDLTDPGGMINEQIDIIEGLVVNLLEQQRSESDNLLQGMTFSFENMRFILTVLGGILIGAGIIIALLTARSIVKPTIRLKNKLISLSNGVIPDPELTISNDEIGEMKSALNQLITGQTSVRKFVNALGSGDFKTHYEPLSPEDEMAPDFIKTRDELAENERITEKKIKERTQELAEKNRIVTELYQDLKDSIQYAKRLQDSILPTDEIIQNTLGNSFIYFNPKEVVSGDFYWVKKIGKYNAFAAIDCTGHGVPGAFMSLVGFNSLNRAISEVKTHDPGVILDRMNVLATQALYRNKGEYEVRDGMDMSLCVFDTETRKLFYAGAGRPLTFVRDGEIVKVKGDRQAIGGATDNSPKFTTHKIQMKKDDMIYALTAMQINLVAIMIQRKRKNSRSVLFTKCWKKCQLNRWMIKK
jgi:methyl-accepting chemotaxis protein